MLRRPPGDSRTRATGLASSLEWAVTATASIAHHLVGLGYVRPAGRRPRPARVVGPGGGPATGPLLDQLAVLEAGDASVLAEAIAMGRASQRGGLLVAVVGALDDESAEELARLRRQGTSCVAVWSCDTEPRAAAAGADPERPSAGHARACVILRNAGWAVADARQRRKRSSQAWERLRTDDHVLTVVSR